MFSDYIKHRNLPTALLLGLTILVVGAIWFITSWRFQLSTDFVPLHYTIYFGFDRFGPKHDLFLFPVLGTVILGVNLVVGRTLFQKNKFWQNILLGLTFLMQVILLVSLVLAVLKGLS